MGGNRTSARRSRWRAVAAGAAILALTASLAACGSDSSNTSTESEEVSASYPVEVVNAEFPARQRLGETTLLRLGVRNAGEETIPALAITFTIGGEEGRQGGLPFGIRDPQPDLAQPDRPVWALSAHYPKLAGSEESAGAETANRKTFDFGPLRPGARTEAVWQLSAVKTGRYRLLYEIGAGFGGEARAESVGGGDAGGSFAVRIVDRPPNTVVTDDGEVVEAPRPRQQIEANR